MVSGNEPSYADLVYEVMQAAGRPLTFREIFDEVNRRRPVTTRNPKGTIRGALGQGRQLISLGDGRYGYLPDLVQGSLLRIPLTEQELADHRLICPAEVREALWPGFFEVEKRRAERPVQVSLPDGDEVVLSVEFFGEGMWGSSMPDRLLRYLMENRASPGDSLLVRVRDARAGRVEARFEPRQQRDDAAVAGRNRELADAVYGILCQSRDPVGFTWDISVKLLARGLYRSDVAPDALKTVLEADPRFMGDQSAWALVEAMTPEARAIFAEPGRLAGDLSHLVPGAPADAGALPSILGGRFAAERALADIGALLTGQEFASIEEANAFLQDALRQGGPPRRTAERRIDQAQSIMYDAWESPDPRERVRLARKALEISPDCADAYVLLADETARSAEEAADLYAKGVAAGERALGREFFEENAGHFWGILETRPYMRARLGLAQALWEVGKRAEAVDHAWEMLRLNPGDNQGVRYVLLVWLLETGDDAQIRRLLDRYRQDASAIWHYSRVLHAYRAQGDTPRARRLLADAKASNPHVPGYLLGTKRLPRRLPETVGFGDESEAAVCAAELMASWRATPGVLAWLARQSV
ncbi:MAG: hypothetical protein HY331_05910 [Chloroflexi bacterium]|nr:hypothetical protein [Chloroflexota bacterium]